MYNIFVCHQPILVFYRYIVNAMPRWYENLMLIVIIVIASLICYFGIEKHIKPSRWEDQLITLFACAFVYIATTCGGLYLYKVAGVVRDIPELDVYTNNIHRGMHAEYCDRVYSMDQDFTDDGRIKVLVVGDSFGRDWVNVLLESNIVNLLDLSYIYTGNLSEEYNRRIAIADYVFLRAETVVKGKFPDYLYDSISDDAIVYGIGTKRYGETNGNVYSHRNDEDYFQQTVSYGSVAELYDAEKKLFGENYIDFITPIVHENRGVPAFTDAGKFISQDCAHLTQAGAQYYARILDLRELFIEVSE